MKIRDNMVHPEDGNNINYWTKKWGVTSFQLNDAILYTGSLNPERLKEYLKKENWLHAFFFALKRLFKNGAVRVH